MDGSRSNPRSLKNSARIRPREQPRCQEGSPNSVSQPLNPGLDAVSELLLHEAGQIRPPVAVLDDLAGGLTRVLLKRDHIPRVWCDDLRSEQQVPHPFRCATPELAVSGARTVLWRLPRAVGALEEYGELIAQHADPGVRVFAAARNKELPRSMNVALARSFASVTASRGHRKARALLASGPLERKSSWPRTAHLRSLGLDVVAHGATFSTNRLDRGTALLADCLDQLPPSSAAIDLGCGSGILATLLAKRNLRVQAFDVLWSAADATRLTALANGVPVDVHRRDGVGDSSGHVDLIVTNPPFHLGASKQTSVTRRLFTEAGQVLSDGGEMWCVYNAHLPYLQWLRQAIGPTRIVARDRAYLVTASVRKARRSAQEPGHFSLSATSEFA